MTTLNRTFLSTLALAVGVALAGAPFDADAKRLGGARSQGMQRTTPDKPVQQQNTPPSANPNATPGAPAAAAAPVAGATAAAAASKRSWMGPIAGLAAGLGLAALFSHLGMGEGLANVVMMVLLALAAFMLIRFVMRRFGAGAAQRPTLATAAASAGAARPAPPRFVDERPGMSRDAFTPAAQPAGASPVTIGSALRPPLAVPGLEGAGSATAPALPADFDVPGFERLAKMLFIRMQAANDSADLNDLRTFTTPELFAALRLDLQDRGGVAQQTDVEQVDASLVDFAQEDGRQIVSVRYTGRVREEADAQAQPFDEVWHLVKPLDDSRSWAIAGIQQRA
jgi:predicted lipid-binding transport protein (Tim44 family)